jgi:uncharacterized membrane protein
MVRQAQRHLDATDQPPAIRKIGMVDLREAFKKGIADFTAFPTHAVFVALIYPVIGLVLFRAAFHYQVVPLLFPLIAGFTLLGPLAAVGLYELSRLREQGLTVTWSNAFGVLSSRSIGAILVLGVILSALFLAWMAVAYSIYLALFGDMVPVSIGDFLSQVFFTPQGRSLILIGNLAGLGFALVAFTISVVAFPLLVDRNVSVTTAILTSLKAVARNPVVMLEWGFFVAMILAVAAVPALLGLAVAVPILGHSTWHLYRRVVV